MNPFIGFSGSRSFPACYSVLVSRVVRAARELNKNLVVGCASGLDAQVRALAPEAYVVTARDRTRAALVNRSVECVKIVAESGAGQGFVIFPGRPAPRPLLPSANSRRCFCGLGSGTWASAAYAVGLGVPVVAFGLELSELPENWGSWKVAGSEVWSEGFLLEPKPRYVPRSLF